MLVNVCSSNLQEKLLSSFCIKMLTGTYHNFDGRNFTLEAPRNAEN